MQYKTKQEVPNNTIHSADTQQYSKYKKACHKYRHV